MSTVRIANLLKIYPEAKGPGVTAVKSINLEIREGEFMVLVGPSGCGKSTTLRMIAGLEDISGGTIAIGDRVVNDVLPKDRNIAMVFQNYALYPHMSVYANMAFGLKLRKTPRAELDRRVREAAALLELEPYLERKPKALSGGQRQRVAVGRAIVRQPAVFLFDEPLSNLDAKMRVSMRAEIVRLHARLGATMIYVTHDQVEAMTMGDRICVMKDGEVMQVDEPINLYQQPENLFVAGFIGSPPMNLIAGTVRRAGAVLHFTETASGTPLQFTLPATLAADARVEVDQPVVLGIRCEDLAIAENGTGVPLRLEMSELMGADTFLHLTSDKHALIARVRPDNYTGVNESMRIRFDLSRAHLFDAGTGRNLRLTPGA